MVGVVSGGEVGNGWRAEVEHVLVFGVGELKGKFGAGDFGASRNWVFVGAMLGGASEDIVCFSDQDGGVGVVPCEFELPKRDFKDAGLGIVREGVWAFGAERLEG